MKHMKWKHLCGCGEAVKCKIFRTVQNTALLQTRSFFTQLLQSISVTTDIKHSRVPLFIFMYPKLHKNFRGLKQVKPLMEYMITTLKDWNKLFGHTYTIEVLTSARHSSIILQADATKMTGEWPPVSTYQTKATKPDFTHRTGAFFCLARSLSLILWPWAVTFGFWDLYLQLKLQLKHKIIKFRTTLKFSILNTDKWQSSQAQLIFIYLLCSLSCCFPFP